MSTRDRDRDEAEWDDLFAELEAWDETFDSLHEQGAEPATDPAPAPDAAGDDEDFDAGVEIEVEPPGELAEGSDPGDEIEISMEAGDPFTDLDAGDLLGGDLAFEGEPIALGALLGDDSGLPVPRPPERRGPAIVRREDLERRRSSQAEESVTGDPFADAASEWDVAPITSVMAKATVDRMVETAAAFFDDEPEEPELELELDGDFYDDIEIETRDAVPEPASESDSVAAPVKRRLMAHVVRRETSSEVTPMPVAPDGESPVVELEAEPDDTSAVRRRQPGVTLNKSELEALLLGFEAGEPEPDLFPTGGEDFDREDSQISVATGVVPRSAILSEAPLAEPAADPVTAEGARALAAGQLSPISLPEVELPPELPPPVLAAAAPGLDSIRLELPELAAEPTGDRTEVAALRLEWAKNALAVEPSGPARARLELWAADLYEELGDIDEAERHARAAGVADPDTAAAAAPLICRALARRGAWFEVCELLEDGVGSPSTGLRTGAGEAEAAALAGVAADLRAALGGASPGAAGGEQTSEIAGQWRRLLATAESRDPAAIAAAIEPLAAAIADAPMRAALARLWLRSGGESAWTGALRIEPGLAADLIGWERVAGRGAGSRAAAAAPIAEALEAAGATALADSFRIVAGEACRAEGERDRALELLSEAADRHAAHPTVARLLLGLLGPEDRELAGFLLAAVSGTALAPEAARALRRWAESESGASRAELLHRALALHPKDPLIRFEIDAADRAAAASLEGESGESQGRIGRAEIEVGLALAPKVAGDPVDTFERARQSRAAGDEAAALAALEGGELPAGELVVAAELLDLAGDEGATLAARGDQLTPISRQLLSRRVALGAGDDAPAMLASLAPGDRVAARLAAALDPALAASPWPGLDAAGAVLDRLADGDLAAARDDLLTAADASGDPRLESLAAPALGAAGDWSAAADRLDLAPASPALATTNRFRAAYFLLEHAGDAAAAEATVAPLLEGSPVAGPAADLAAAARRQLGIGAAEIPRPAAVRPDDRDPYAAAVRAAEALEQSGDASAAITRYQEILAERPGDPVARLGLEWAARSALEAGPLAERALAALRVAEDDRDAGARADAYEELARVDDEITGDPASALLAWESAADCDPSRMAALRALERAYVSGARHRDLLKLYGRLLAVAEGSAEASAILTMRARSAELADRDAGEILASYRQILELGAGGDPVMGERLALFHLESSASGAGPSPERADLERRVAGLLGSDPRSTAAFLCRSAETLLALRDHEAAIERFGQAIATRPGHLPSIRGWREAARRAERWDQLATATEAEALATAADEASAALLHLAGVVWMDRVRDGDEATRVLAAALGRQPTHADALARLRALYDETGDDEALGDLFRARLEAETRPALALALHLELARLCRNFWEDREGASAQLRAALEIAPQNREAISELSDIAWELGAWDQAAEVLIKRAKLETDETVLKHIFYRLGTIYADHLPDNRWAVRCFRKVLSYDPSDIATLERLALLAAESGDYKTAQAAYEKLLRQDLAPEDKVRMLHHIADIQERGFQSPAGAERALRLAFDVAPGSSAALERLVGFYTRAGDLTSIRVNLDRAAQAMRAQLNTDVAAPEPFAVVARVLAAREAAGVRGSLAVARSAAEIARALGDESRAIHELAAARPAGRPRLEGLAQPEVIDLLAPRSLPAGLRVLLHRLRSRLAKFVDADVKRFGVGRGDRLRRGKHPVANLAHDMATELGADGIDVYVSAASTDKVMVLPASPAAVILGSQFASLDRGGELAFALGRCLVLSEMGAAIVDSTTPAELDLLITGIVRQFLPDFPGFGHEDAEIEAERHRLRRLIPGSMVSDLRPHALSVTGLAPGAIHAGLRQLGLRAGLIAAGDAAAALAGALRNGGYSTCRQAAGDPDIGGMLRFALSEEHVEIRALLEA